jgi:hypothetical protein
MGLVMSSSTNPIKALVLRFVSLQPAVRVTVTKKLLELYGSEQAAREAKASPDACSPLIKKSFLEQFWEEVEKAHGDNPHAVNPFTEQRRAKGRNAVDDAPQIGVQDGYLHWPTGAPDLFALL